MGRWLAQRENGADLIGGVGSVSLDDKDDVLASVLLDMSMTASQSSSREVAKRVHDNIARFAKMHKPYVEQAGFVVLKSPDIPSILVETGFISNPSEAKKLSNRSYQKRMAQAVVEGIKAHFWERPPARTHIAMKKRGGTALASGRAHLQGGAGGYAVGDSRAQRGFTGRTAQGQRHPRRSYPGGSGAANSCQLSA